MVEHLRGDLARVCPIVCVRVRVCVCVCVCVRVHFLCLYHSPLPCQNYAEHLHACAPQSPSYFSCHRPPILTAS